MPAPGATGFRRWTPHELRRLLARLFRFGLVGGLATLTHAGVALLALRGLGPPPVLANFVGFCVAFAVSFLGHSLFTFGVVMSLARALRFSIVALGSIALSSALVLAFQHGTSLRPDLYLPLVALLTPAFNFVCHSLWTFRGPSGMVR